MSRSIEQRRFFQPCHRYYWRAGESSTLKVTNRCSLTSRRRSLQPSSSLCLETKGNRAGSVLKRYRLRMLITALSGVILLAKDLSALVCSEASCLYKEGQQKSAAAVGTQGRFRTPSLQRCRGREKDRINSLWAAYARSDNRRSIRFVCKRKAVMS